MIFSHFGNFNLNRLLPGIFLGILLTSSVGFIYAQVANTVIHACYKNSNGVLRILAVNQTCDNNETALDWNQQGPAGATGAVGATGVSGATGATGANGSGGGFGQFRSNEFGTIKLEGSAYEYRNFDNGKFIGTYFENIVLRNSTFHNADFTDAFFTLPSMDNADFTGANFTGVKLHAGYGTTNANYVNTNFSNVNFTNANLRFQYSPEDLNDMSQAIFTNATWSNTTCPDGTNSDNNGNTCVGHLSP